MPVNLCELLGSFPYIWDSDITRDFAVTREELLGAVRVGDLIPRHSDLSGGFQVETRSFRIWVFKRMYCQHEEIRAMFATIMGMLSERQPGRGTAQPQEPFIFTCP